MSNQVQATGSADRVRLGLALCLFSMLVFACLDALTKLLVQDIHIAQVLLVRYVVFAGFALIVALRSGGLRLTLRTQHPYLQGLRSLLCLLDVAIFSLALRYLGLAEAHSLYAVFPLIALALAGLLLGERIGLHQGVAAVIGFIGTLVILRPGLSAFDPLLLIPLLAAVDFALFNIVSRKVGMADSFATNTFYMAFGGLILTAGFGIAYWQPLNAEQWTMLLVLSVGGVLANMLLLQAFKFTPAAMLQPYNYSLLLFATLVGYFAFGQWPDSWTVVGAILILLGGLLALRKAG